MILNGIPISEDECIGDSLAAINNAFVTLSASANAADLQDRTINTVRVGLGAGNVVSNTVVGKSALSKNTIGYNTTAIGFASLAENTTGNDNTSVGHAALASNTVGNSNTAVGYRALQLNTSGGANSAFGWGALNQNTTGTNNAALGVAALYNNTTGEYNSAFGSQALADNTTGSSNVATGSNSLRSNINGIGNVANGLDSLYSNDSGNWNVAAGAFSLRYNQTGSYNTALGYAALESTNYDNTVGIGTYASVTAPNQLQLGQFNVTTYAYGAVQDRSDIRDKTDVRDTQLGLEFINALRPVDFKWDMREAYRPEAPKPVVKPAELKEDASDEEKAKHKKELADYNSYKVELDKWFEDVKLQNITRDGSKKRNRFHHGLIAQEVKAVLDSKGIDFGGFQDHKISGGDDVLSIGYTELIGPLIKSVQELSKLVEDLKAEVDLLKQPK